MPSSQISSLSMFARQGWLHIIIREYTTSHGFVLQESVQPGVNEIQSIHPRGHILFLFPPSQRRECPHDKRGQNVVDKLKMLGAGKRCMEVSSDLLRTKVQEAH